MLLSDALKQQYGEKVYKLALSAGCTCPNRDGTIGTGGCSFCSAGGSGEFAAPPAPVDQQIREAKARIRAKTDASRFIAYFQAYTNTYGDVDRLSALYEEVIAREEIAALSLGTRPDCLGTDVMEMLKRLRRHKDVWIELGLQTIHEETARSIRRGYPLAVFDEAVRKLKAADIQVIVHVIFGLPGESREQMLETVRYLAGMQPRPDGVKLQMLQILSGTDLGEAYLHEPFPLLTLEEYTDLVAESIQILPQEMVLHRLTGDPPGRLLIAPEWTRNKKKVLNTIRKKSLSQS